jgi:hypothetical protein
MGKDLFQMACLTLPRLAPHWPRLHAVLRSSMPVGQTQSAAPNQQIRPYELRLRYSRHGS